MKVSSGRYLLPFLQVPPVTFAHSPEEYFTDVGVQPSRPHADSKPEPQAALPPSDQSHELTATPGDLRSEEGPADPSSSTGHLQQLQAAFQEQSKVKRWLTLHDSESEQAPRIKREPDTDSGTDRHHHHHQQQQKQGKQKSRSRSGQHQTASSKQPSHGPIGSPPAKIVSLSSLQPGSSAQQPPQRAIPGGMPSFPVGSTTGIVGRGWPGQPQHANNPIRAGDGKGTKRPGGDGESKGKKRQRRSDREKSVDGEGED